MLSASKSKARQLQFLSDSNDEDEHSARGTRSTKMDIDDASDDDDLVIILDDDDDDDVEMDGKDKSESEEEPSEEESESEDEPKSRTNSKAAAKKKGPLEQQNGKANKPPLKSGKRAETSATSRRTSFKGKENAYEFDEDAMAYDEVSPPKTGKEGTKQMSLNKYFSGGSSTAQTPAPVKKATVRKPRKSIGAAAKSKRKSGAGLHDDDEDDEDTSPASTYSPPFETGTIFDVVSETLSNFDRSPFFPDAENLEPISKLPEMFADIVKRFPAIPRELAKLEGRPLRIATMCSGTESPLLALRLLLRAVDSMHGVQAAVDHVFSCEIEPFKQAYIERNFAPPILFRDVLELGNDEAATAYGAHVAVPGDVDMLIAGTSCVDYSNLNTKKQGLDSGGESGNTFNGMLRWVNRHRPLVVILENVMSAPWGKVVERFEGIGYDAKDITLDTKQYYIPHTRQRGYLIATLRGPVPSDTVEKWDDLMKRMQRYTSTTIDDYLLETDDTRVHNARMCLSRQDNGGKGPRGTVDWGKCRTRHAYKRIEEMVGTLRPLTSWTEGGICTLPDYAWGDWAKAQVDRVLDFLDIMYLTMARRGFDATYKTIVWNASQNVDRTPSSFKPGISPCLTPNIIPFVTNRGGPIIGLEALGLQGIPVDELLMTRETEDNLLDLAGNAMSSTVVGSAIMAAVMLCGNQLAERVLERKTDKSYTAKSREERALKEQVDLMDHIVGVEALEERLMVLAPTESITVGTLLETAAGSARMCRCEGRRGIAMKEIKVCGECGHTACVVCLGKPDHTFKKEGGEVVVRASRVKVDEFEAVVAKCLPMRLRLAGFTREVLEELRATAVPELKIDGTLWEQWLDATVQAVTLDDIGTFCHASLRRRTKWTLTYRCGARARLCLVIEREWVRWLLYVSPPAGSSKALKEALKKPVARMTVDCSDKSKSFLTCMLDGEWSVLLPAEVGFKLSITGHEEVLSWESRIGLEAEFKDKKVWSRYEIRGGDERLDAAISGEFRLISKCGTAMDSLHVRDDIDASHRLFFFLDPSPCGLIEKDSFVFSYNSARIEHGETREIIATLDPSWRPHCKPGSQEVHCTTPGVWRTLPAMVLSEPDIGDKDDDNEMGTLPQARQAVATVPEVFDYYQKANGHGCDAARALVKVKVPIADGVDTEHGGWPAPGKIKEIDLLREGKEVFEKLAWFTGKIVLPEFMHDWMVVMFADGVRKEGDATPCTRCAPAEPDIVWVPAAKGKGVEGIEEPKQAAVYEQALKNRPGAFISQLYLAPAEVAPGFIGSFTIGVNHVSLIHRALSRLPDLTVKCVGQAAQHKREDPVLSWRVTALSAASYAQRLKPFKLMSNKLDAGHNQPPGFVNLKLRPEQLRSLAWMVRQEASSAEPFMEEEVSEASLEPLGMMLEGRATRNVTVRGGVVADEVGYGKTVITLGLIDVQKRSNLQTTLTFEEAHGLIPLKATLVLVPPHLLNQWPSEIDKFLGKSDHKLTLLVIKDLSGLNKARIKDFEKADIVVASSKLFDSPKYWENFETVAAECKLPANAKKGGRHFISRYTDALAGLRVRVNELVNDGGPKKMLESIQEGQNAMLAEADNAKKVAPSKRYKGAMYKKVNAASAASKVGEAVTSKKSKPIAKVKGKATAKAVKKRRISDSEEDDHVVEESSDGDSSSAVSDEDDDADGSSKQRKARKIFGSNDPWGLSTSEVQRDWKKMKCPPFEMFHWNRVVVDEFTYLDNRIHAVAVMGLQSSFRWILSGTPPLKDFHDIKGIANFLGVHLGVDDEADFNSAAAKRRRKEATRAERFHAFREVHTPQWHARRHELAQSFLDRFVRQNVAEIDEIPAIPHCMKIDLPPAERAIYLELQHYLNAIEMNSGRAKKTKKSGDGDREARMKKALGKSGSAEEALLKRCSHFDVDLDERTDEKEEGKKGKGKENGKTKAASDEESEGENEECDEEEESEEEDEKATKRKRGGKMAPVPAHVARRCSKKLTALETCDEIVTYRQREFENCANEIGALLKAVHGLRLLVRSRSDFSDYVSEKVKPGEASEELEKWVLTVTENSINENEDDHEARDLLEAMIQETGCIVVHAGGQKKSMFDAKAGKSQPTKAPKGKKQESEDFGQGIMYDPSKKIHELVQDIREAVHGLRKLYREFCGRVRSLRFFRSVRNLLSDTTRDELLLKVAKACPGPCLSADSPLDINEVALFSCCGHIGKLDCMAAAAEINKCPESGCGIHVHETALVKAASLGVDKDLVSGTYGKKMYELVRILKEKVLSAKSKVKGATGPGERALVFVQFPDLMEKVSEALSEADIGHLQIRGTPNQKSNLLTQFQNMEEGKDVLLLNVIDESASGANLTVANHVFFVGPLLTPTQEICTATETQAIGRCRRYGQEKKVHIYRLITEDTIDSVIYEKREQYLYEARREQREDA
ncbi:hypothetical protein HK101_009798 [Irineochytrium annulatum]|nr:hypothetical protein HK101_009798 [Irineochytrium annulatum]